MPINYKDYHPDCKIVIRLAILIRSFGYCEFCNVQNRIVIIRGEYFGHECYQDENGRIYDSETSEVIGDDYIGSVGSKPFTTICLTIAHLDHDINNNDYSNLRALCQRCHNRYDRSNRNANIKAKKELLQPKLF